MAKTRGPQIIGTNFMGVDLGLSGFEMLFRFRFAGGEARTDHSEQDVDQYTNERTEGDAHSSLLLGGF